MRHRKDGHADIAMSRQILLRHRKYGHADITMSRQILLRAQKRWSRRYHTAQADIIEGTEKVVTQISHYPGRYY